MFELKQAVGIQVGQQLSWASLPSSTLHMRGQLRAGQPHTPPEHL